ncbi:hypothetical protein HYALB_00002723 [Hymenoscyphus albidus]|uniref:Mediator of RNA polymerase II transcription subunit 4 n=1 Tax=Hymenoscyphus albidus TaxID=595503 RepID=A0A9N9M549_9HELO|nr:hypothetical protein HYALB_00002723 [Hymenoscyphus albidus]
MNEIVDKRFARVEKALATLVQSLSTYNPSTAHANDLVAADKELSQGLEQVSKHQANYAKIQELRVTSDQLDAQIRDTLILLTTTRQELLATSSTSFPASANTVSYSELLSYARRISKFTLPSTYREGEVKSNSDTGEAGTNTPREPGSQSHTNGNSTPVAPLNGVGSQMTGIPSFGENSAVAAQSTEPSSQTALPTEWTQYLNAPGEAPFVPWPSEDIIRRGALASIEILINKGVDPATFDPEKSAELEAERKRIQEEEDLKRAEELARMEEERRKAMERRMSSSAGVQRPQEKSAFQLETFDDDDED